MAINLGSEFPGKVGTATPDYPTGVPRNVSSPGAGDGTPWDEKVIKDFVGFRDASLKAAGVTADGSPETANASQVLDSLRAYISIDVGSLISLLDVPFIDGKQYQNAGFYPGTTVGGGTWKAVADADLTQNNGGTFVSKQALQAWYDYAVSTYGDASFESLSKPDSLQVLFAAGTGTGDAFVRIYQSQSEIDLSHWGAVGDGVSNDSVAFNQYNESELLEFNGVYGKNYLVNRNFEIKSNRLYKGRFSKVTCIDPPTTDYHFLTTGEDDGDGKFNFEIFDWILENEFTEGGFGETRRAIWAGDNSNNFKIRNNKCIQFYWCFFAASVAGGPANQNSDGSFRVPYNFEIYDNEMVECISTAIFLVKGPRGFRIHDNIIEDAGKFNDSFGHGILIDYVSASEGGDENAVKCKDGRIYRNKITRTRQGGITNAGNDNIRIYKNEVRDVGFYTGGDDSVPISCGVKFSGVPNGCKITDNIIGPCSGSAIQASGKVDVGDNEIEDACLDGGSGYIVLGQSATPWVDSKCRGNVINRVNGANVAALTIRGAGSTANCIIGPNKYPGHVAITSRYLNLTSGAVVDPSCTIVGQVKTGRQVISGDGSTRQFTFPNKLGMSGTTEINVMIQPLTEDARAPYLVSLSGNNIAVTYDTAPPAGTDNVSFMWMAFDPLHNL